MASVYQNRIAHELAVIKAAAGQFPQGASFEELKAVSGLKLELRTFQRRLETLVKRKEMVMVGSKRTAKYHLVKPGDISFPTEIQTNTKDVRTQIPLSKESLQILDILSSSVEQREVTGYNRDFLDRYRPNIDFYLNEDERKQLSKDTSTAVGDAQPAGTYAKHILQRLLIDLSWNSSRLEGNTYSLLDTERLLSQGEAAPGKSAEEAQMILNHKDAIEFIVAGAGDIGFNRYTILNIHAMLANNLLPDPAAPGRLRSLAVGIRNSAYTPTAIPQLIEEMFELMLKKASMISNPHEQALFIMIHLPYLQPFEDVNRRVSRLAANIPLNQHNLVPLSFISVPDDLYIKGLLSVYELNRTALLKDIFLWACAKSADRYAQVRQTIHEPDPFRIKYMHIMQKLITEILLQGLSKEKAAGIIQLNAVTVPEEDRARFIELIETELLSLHEGNFARYRITPSEFRRWQDIWAGNAGK